MLELADVISEGNYVSTYTKGLSNKNKDQGGLTSNELANHMGILDTLDYFKAPMRRLRNNYYDFDKKDQALIEQFAQFLKSVAYPMSLLDKKPEKRKLRRGSSK